MIFASQLTIDRGSLQTEPIGDRLLIEPRCAALLVNGLVELVSDLRDEAADPSRSGADVEAIRCHSTNTPTPACESANFSRTHRLAAGTTTSAQFPIYKSARATNIAHRSDSPDRQARHGPVEILRTLLSIFYDTAITRRRDIGVWWREFAAVAP